MDDVDGDDKGCRGGLRSGDDGIGVWANAIVVVVVVDEDCEGRRQRHAAWIRTTIIALTIDWFDDDGGGKTKPAVIIDGETYCVVKLRQGAVVPRRQ